MLQVRKQSKTKIRTHIKANVLQQDPTYTLNLV